MIGGRCGAVWLSLSLKHMQSTCPACLSVSLLLAEAALLFPPFEDDNVHDSLEKGRNEEEEDSAWGVGSRKEGSG